MDLLIVESPAKAKTINKYLGSNYTVMASFGHIRDLASKNGSVDPDADFAMNWEIGADGKKRISDIIKSVKSSDTIYLATDPDREGEAIAWHILEELKAQGKLKDKKVKRVVFHEITKTAIKKAMENPRDIDTPLVDAYLARRALDYLVGFNISPILWRKLPGAKSAGRVQSVALKLVCEREGEIDVFKAQEYWDIKADMLTLQKMPFSARLTSFNGKKVEKFTFEDEKNALVAKTAVEKASFKIGEIERKSVKKNPYAPFTTSTLQQDASRKFHFPAKKIMQLAQKLYEGIEVKGEVVGLITYMRTDSVQMSQEAILGARDTIKSRFGENYLPDAQRVYTSKAKNAQEAHEAIRPTHFDITPDIAYKYLEKDMARLYELIYKRAIASQMKSAVIERMGIDINSSDNQITLRATGSRVAFDGFLKLYNEDSDDKKDDDETIILPEMNTGEASIVQDVSANQHFTAPPPRYTEASLVKKMEELGIGRPSTYASIISVLQDRGYVRLEDRKFIPEDRGRIVTIFLDNYFKKYVEYDFTADLEGQLDEISAGNLKYKDVLRGFWSSFSVSLKDVDPLTITAVIDTLDNALAPHLFPTEESRKCPDCKDGRLGIKTGRFGAFIGCSNYPECKHTKPLGETLADENGEVKRENFENLVLGVNLDNGYPITLKKGPYGFYVEEASEKPKRTSLPKNMDPDLMTLENALFLLSLPKDLGEQDGKKVQVGIGRFGPYVKLGTAFKSIPASMDIFTIKFDDATELLKGVKEKAPAKVIGKHPESGKEITLNVGRFGPYVKMGTVMASLPKALKDENRDPTLEEAVELIAKKAPATKGKAKKAPAKKTAAKKAPAKKTVAKKATTKTATKKAPAKKTTKK